MKIILSPDARNYAKSEAEYLSKRSPPAARQFSDDLKRLRDHLRQFPKMGHAADEMPVSGILRFVMGQYLVTYEVRKEIIVVLAIRHGQQRPPGTAIENDFDFEDPSSDA